MNKEKELAKAKYKGWTDLTVNISNARKEQHLSTLWNRHLQEDNCSPSLKLIYSIRMRIIAKAYYRNSSNYKHIKELCLDNHPGFASLNDVEWGIILDFNKVEEQVERGNFSTFKNVDIEFWSYRYDLWKGQKRYVVKA
jgi:hypothetical protein